MSSPELEFPLALLAPADGAGAPEGFMPGTGDVDPSGFRPVRAEPALSGTRPAAGGWPDPKWAGPLFLPPTGAFADGTFPAGGVCLPNAFAMMGCL